MSTDTLPSTLPGVLGVAALSVQPVQNGAPASASTPAARTPCAFYTTRELQSFLHVDRTTIYRMADSGRLPGVKVGSQWRFPRRTVDQWLADHGSALPAEPAPELAPAAVPQNSWPTSCLQILQETFAEALGVTVLMTDLDGHPLTEPSNLCGYLRAIQQAPQAHARCLQWWAELARHPSLHPTFLPSHAGVLCTRGFFRHANQLVGMVILAGVAPANWPPSQAELERIADRLAMAPADLQPHLHEIFRIDAAQEQRLLAVVQRIADVVTHILDERARLLNAPA